MSLLDKVPGDLKLYIGGLFTLRRKGSLRECGITHVLSVLRLPLDQDLFEGYKHHVIEVDDVDDENLLQYLPEAIKFIQDGLDSGGAVLVHCAMGKSRSATCVVAYLMKRFDLWPKEALAKLREARPFVEPNPGFMEQLQLFRGMGMPDEMDSIPAYQRWLYKREIELSRACGQAPEPDKIRFEDEHTSGSAGAAFELRCRKCRRALATSQYLVEHDQTSRTSCAHYFLDPLTWMKPELEQSKLEGRLECPKCNNNVGKYAWQGMRCSCGGWVVPAISLAKGRIDEHKILSTTNRSNMGIRQPPGIGQGNL
ncbi:dual specificity protein phosphatase 12 [Myriangium duriaei CBS 260.36]|uniref:protein-tyrosine-phosphatase n=1 Tax=Myriangium duriaei CBS 260.36 TaxID=1168546 RepID=A0A9P4JB42_9PEZI|nr:dual specificity protein phosphatase 12 [Myriangium duriaei CBS 260.36]